MPMTPDAHRNGKVDTPGARTADGPPATSEAAAELANVWPRTNRPMRIAIMGWARLSSQAWEGSGYNLSASELARGLVMAGHEVTYLQSGMTYRLKKKAPPDIVLRETWAGIRCFDLRNSPNISPSASNFTNIPTEISCPSQTELVLDWLDDVGAQLVHIHSLEGFSLDLIPSIRRGHSSNSAKRHASRPVLVTPHNYWYVCPQVDLLHHETRVCMDYDGGLRCVGCLPSLDIKSIRKTRASKKMFEERIGPHGAEIMKQMAEGWPATWKRLKKGKLLPPRFTSPPLNPDRLVDPELARGFRGVSATSDPKNDGTIRHDLPLGPGEHPRHLEPSPIDQNEKFLRADVHLRVLNVYGRRRIAGIESLNAANAILSPSNFLLKAHASMGVLEHKLHWVRLGQPHFDQINRKARRSPFYNDAPWDPRSSTRPLRFGFFGTTRNNKGLEVVLQAIPMLDRAIRQRCHFYIRALGWDWAARKRMSLYPEVTFAGGYDLYQLIAAAGDYDVGILPHIWFENSPLVMLEHLHAGKFIIASRLGGPPDWIDPPNNGMLFAAGRADELAACITTLAKGEVRIPSPRQIHDASVLQSYPAHVAEVQRIYQRILDQRETGAQPASQDAAALGA